MCTTMQGSTTIQSTKRNNVALPANFVPSKYSVIVGKSKISKTAPGNAQLKNLAQVFLEEYAKATNKTEKSKIVSKVVDLVHSKCPVGAFIKHSKEGQWYKVSNAVAREKVGYCFRDLLHDKYKSSSASKAAKRRLSKLGTEHGQPLPQDHAQQPQHRRVSLLPSTVLSEQPLPASVQQPCHEQPLVEEISFTVNERRVSPVLSISKPTFYANHVQYDTQHFSSSDDCKDDLEFIPDLEPLPFDRGDEEPLVEYQYIIIDDLRQENSLAPYSEQNSVVLPTLTSSAMALMSIRPHDILSGSSRLSGGTRTVPSRLPQPYPIASSTNCYRDLQALISVTDKGPLDFSNFIMEHCP